MFKQLEHWCSDSSGILELELPIHDSQSWHTKKTDGGEEEVTGGCCFDNWAMAFWPIRMIRSVFAIYIDIR